MAPVLEVRDLHKAYGGVLALRGAHLTLSRPGEVHGLMGENGSGKSSLLRILAGQARPDRGQVLLGGRPARHATPADALAAGVAMVAQETAVAPTLSVAENLLLGRRLVRTRWGIDWRATRRRAAEALGRLNLDYDPARLVATLRPGERQMVEIARAISMDARVLILDEPTSSLTEDEVEHLHAAVRDLSRSGVSVILVSHRITEVFELAQRLTVLRDGRTAATGAAAGFTVDSLVEAMVGPETEAGAAPARSSPGSEPVLEAGSLSHGGSYSDVSLTVARGEIVGVAGLAGAGRSELLAGIFAPARGALGTVRVAGSTLERHTAREAIRAGLGYVPPDRANGGLLLRMSVRDNVVIVRNSRLARLRRPRRDREVAVVEPLRDRMRIRTSSTAAAVSSLSGGNQQKIALGRWLTGGTAVLMLDEPTRGVDVAAKREIHGLLRQCAAEGMGLLVSSSEYDELLELCDRILVMSRGEVVRDLPRAQATESVLSQLAGGHR